MNRNKKGQFIKGNKLGFQKGNKIRLKAKNSEKQKRIVSNYMKRNNPMKKGMQPKNSRNWKGKNHPLYGKKRPEISGEKNNNWKGGITPLRQKIYHSLEYKKWREAVFKRDNYTCQRCGKTNCYLEAHHKKEFYKIMMEYKITTFRKTLKCKPLWNIDNGQTLCKECHNLTKKFIANQYVTKKL